MISLVTNAILDALRSALTPLLEPGRIRLCSPANSEEDLCLGVHIFSLSKDKRYQMTEKIHVDSSVRQSPPLCLELGVMVTPYLGRKSGAENDYKLLERVLTLWADSAELPLQSPLQPGLIPLPRMELLSPDVDTLSKIWQFPNTPAILSLFYKCAPVAIASPKQTVTPRVGGVDYTAKDGAVL